MGTCHLPYGSTQFNNCPIDVWVNIIELERARHRLECPQYSGQCLQGLLFGRAQASRTRHRWSGYCARVAAPTTVVAHGLLTFSWARAHGRGSRRRRRLNLGNAAQLAQRCQLLRPVPTPSVAMLGHWLSPLAGRLLAGSHSHRDGLNCFVTVYLRSSQLVQPEHQRRPPAT